MSSSKATKPRAGGGDQSLHARLVASAVRIIAKHGTVGLTVRKIADEAGLANGALYNHFDDKEELIALALREHVQSVVHDATLPEPGTATLEENLREYIAFGMTTIARLIPAFSGVFGHPKVISRLHEYGDPESGVGIPSLLKDYLVAEQALGRIAADADVQAATALIVGVCHQAALPGIFTGIPQQKLVVSPEFINSLARTVLAGIAPR